MKKKKNNNKKKKRKIGTQNDNSFSYYLLFIKAFPTMPSPEDLLAPLGVLTELICNST